MANNVEERIVQMKFDNAQFEQGIKTSMSSLESFDKSLRSKEGTQGLTAIAENVEKLSSKFSAMGIVATTALVNITNSALNAGKNIAKALTIEPITTGLNEYELKMGSVQTILMGTGESLDVVMDKLEELNKYSDRTIYSFQDMTSNIGKFTNAGVKLDVATKAIQGVSNLAAVSGADAAEASRAMYNISQALGTGYMQLMDWKSIENANMATMEFKQTLIDTAKEMGVLNDTSNVTAENFRESLNDKWLTNNVLLKTLMKYTDETTELGKKAFAAATEIKTATQLFDVMKESVQSGWATTWENIIGNFDEAKKLFTGIGQVFDFFAGRSADARNSVLKDWKELGGRQAIIQSLYNTFANLLLIIKPFKEAFRNVFPPVTGKTLADLSKKLADFTGKIWISKDAADGLKNIITLLLSPLKAIINGLKIGWSVAKVFATVLWYLSQAFLASFKNMSGFNNILQKIFGDERYSRILAAWNKLLGNIQNGVISLISGIIKLGNAITELPLVKSISKEVSNFIGSGIDKFLNIIVNAIEKLANFDFTFPNVDLSFLNSYTSLDDILGSLREKYENTKDSIKEFFGTLNKGTSFLDSFKDKFEIVIGKFKEFTAGITASKLLLFAFGVSLVALILRFTKVGEATGELIESFTRITKGIGKTIKVFAFNKKANGILKIAAAFGILAASLVALTTLVDSKELIAAAVALGILGAELSVITFILGKFTNFGDILQVVGSLVGLAASVMVITKALNVLNGITFKKNIWQKLGILAATLAGFSTIAIVLSKLAPKMSGGSLFLVAFAFAVDKLVTAMGKLNDLRLTASEGIIKEMIALMGLIGGFVLIAGRMKISSAAGILLLAATIDIIIGAFNKIKDNIDLSGLSKGFDSVKNAIVKIKDFILDSTIIDIAKYSVLAYTVGQGLLRVGMGLYFILSGINALSKGIIRVAIAAAIVIASLKMLEGIKPETIDNSVKVIKQLFTSMTGLAAVLGLFSGGFSFDNKELSGSGGLFQTINGLSKGMKAVVQLGKSASKIGTAMIKLSVAVGILVGVMKLMEYLDLEKMRTNLIAVEILLSTFGVLVAMTAFAKKSGPIIALAAIIGTLVAALALFTLIKGKELMQSAKCLGIAFASIGLMMRSLKDLDFKEALSGVITLAGIVLGIRVLLPGLKAMGDFDWDNGIKAAASLTILAIGLSTAARILAGIESFDELGASLISFAGISAVMVGTGIALGKFAKEFYEIDWQSLIAGSISLGIMANAFASAALILSKIKDIEELGGSLISFAGIAAVMVGVAYGLGTFARDFMSIPFEGLIAGAISLGIMANAFASASMILSKAKFDSFESMAQSMIGFIGIAAAMSIAVNLIAPAFQKMADIPWNTLIGAGAAVAEMAIGMSVATGILAIFADFMEQHVVGMITGAGAMIAVGVAARIMAPAMELLSGIPFSQIVKGLIGLVGTFAALGVSAYLFGKNIAKIGPGLLVLGAFIAALYLLIPPLKELATIDFLSALEGIGSLAATIGTLGVLAYILGSLVPQMLLGSVVLAAFGAALRLIVPPLQQLATIDFLNALEGIGALAVAILALGACSVVLSALIAPMLLGSVVLAAFGLALKVLTPQIERISQLDFMSVIQGIGGMAVAIVALGVCAGILGALFPVMAAGTLVLVGFGVSVGVLAVALNLGANAVNSFSIALAAVAPPLQTLGSMNLTGIAGGLGLIAIASAAMGIAGLALIPASLGLIAFATALGLLAIAISSLNTVLEGAEALSNLFQAGVNIATNIVNGIKEGCTNIGLAGIDAVSGFISGISSAISTVWDKGVELGATFIEGLRSKGGIDSHSDSKQTIAAAKDSIGGFVTGIISSLKKIANSGEKTGKTYIDATRKVTDREIPRASKDIMEKYADGLEANADLVEKSGESVGRKTLRSVMDGIKESKPELAGTIDQLGNYIEDHFGAVIDSINISPAMQSLIERAIGGSDISNLLSMFGISDEEGSETDTNPFDDLMSGLDSVGSAGSGAASGVKEASDALKDLRDNIESGMDMFSKFDDTVDITMADMIVNIQSQIEGVSKWSKDLANLTAKGFDEALVQKIAEQGLSGYKYVEAMQSATEAQILAYNYMFKEYTQSADVAIEHIKEALPTLTAKIASETGKTIEMVGHATDEAENVIDVTESVIETVEDTVEPVNELTESVSTEAEAMADLTDQTGTAQEGLEDMSDATESTGENMGEAAENTEKFGKSIQLTTEQTIEFVKGMAKIDSELETIKKSLKETIESQIDIFEKFDDESSISKEELLSNMQSQLNGVASWASGMNTLFERGIDEGLLAHLRELGPEGSQYVKAFLEMTDAELSRAGQMYADSLTISDTISQQMVDKMRESGTYSVEGLLEGILGMQDSVYEAGAALATSYNAGYTEAEQIHSPSVVQFNNGVNDAQGLINGINSMLDAVRNTGRAMGYALTNKSNGFRSVADYDDFYKIGQNIDRGLIDGIRSMTDKVSQEAATMAQSAYDAACKALDVNSPSGMFREIGMYSDIGFAYGLRDYAGVVEESSKSVGEAALETMRDAIIRLNEYAMSDIEDPVIRPILDLSEIQNGAKDVNSMLDFGGSYRLASSATRSFTNSQDATVTYSNNYDNSDVVNAIGQLRADFANLKLGLGNVQVVMDTGTLVGELVDPIDSALGQKMNFNGRGV